MRKQPAVHLFLLGQDYHLGDLLWFTTVLDTYRRHYQPEILVVGCPDRPISRILDENPLIDAVFYGEAQVVAAITRARYGRALLVHDLRPMPIAVAMLRAWHARRPWRYYRDLWLEERGQWLATYLRLGPLQTHRPVLQLVEEDRAAAQALARPYVALAPHVGRMSLGPLDWLWKRLKGWEDREWEALAAGLWRAGYQPVTLGESGTTPIPGTVPAIGLPLRQAAGLIERAEALITVESGLWYVAAAFGTPLVIVPWWLPRSVDWVAPMAIPYRLVYRDQASASHVLGQFEQLRNAQGGVSTDGEHSAYPGARGAGRDRYALPADRPSR